MTDPNETEITISSIVAYKKNVLIAEIKTRQNTITFYKNNYTDPNKSILSLENLSEKTLNNIILSFLNSYHIKHDITKTLWYVQYQTADCKHEIGRIKNGNRPLKEILDTFKTLDTHKTFKTITEGHHIGINNISIETFYEINGTIKNINGTIHGKKFGWYNGDMPFIQWHTTTKMKDSTKTIANPRDILYEIVNYWKDTTQATEHETITILKDIKNIPEDTLISMTQSANNNPDYSTMNKILDTIIERKKTMKNAQKTSLFIEGSFSTGTNGFFLKLCLNKEEIMIHRIIPVYGGSEIFHLRKNFKKTLNTAIFDIIKKEETIRKTKNIEWNLYHDNGRYNLRIGEIQNKKITIENIYSILTNKTFNHKMKKITEGPQHAINNHSLKAHYKLNGDLNYIDIGFNNDHILWYNKENCFIEICGKRYRTNSITESKNLRQILYEIIQIWKDTTHATEHETLDVINAITTMRDETLDSIAKGQKDHPYFQDIHNDLNRILHDTH